MIDREKVIEEMKRIRDVVDDAICFENWGTERDLNALDNALELLKQQAEEIRELREAMTEMSTNGGTGNQQDVCLYLLNLMDGIEQRQRRASDA